MAHTAREYGEVVPLRFGPMRAVLLTNPSAIEAVLIGQQRSFRKAAGVRRLSTLLGNGLLLSEGDFWLKQRRMMQPAFHRAAVAHYGEVMNCRTQVMLRGWQAGATIDAADELRARPSGSQSRRCSELRSTRATSALFGRHLLQLTRSSRHGSAACSCFCPTGYPRRGTGG